MFQDTLIVYDDGTPRTRHVTTDLAIEVDEHADSAMSRSYVTVLQAPPDLPLQPIAAGRYHDRRPGHRTARAEEANLPAPRGDLRLVRP